MFLFIRHTAARVLARSGALLALLMTMTACAPSSDIPQWGVFEAAFAAASESDDPFQEQELLVTFTSPSKKSVTVRGFWDGGSVWRVRFSPDEQGLWTFSTRSVPVDEGLHGRSGRFEVGSPRDGTPVEAHGPVRVAASGTHLEHADGTPFFWLADTGWNAALKATPDEWTTYLETRREQGFNAIQWVATEWRAAPTGDRTNERAYSGRERIAVNTAFFQRLDSRVAALHEAGLLNVPVLLWAISSGADPDVNPGHSLPEDQAILLARYMVARWQAYPSVWLLAGDGDYRGQRAERWKRIGRAVFGDEPHAPVALHPGGQHWILDDFLDEPWLGIHGYQSGHGDDERALRWITEGPASTEWKTEPARPFINLEPPYEYHLGYQSRQPLSPYTVRRAIWWSLLNAPTAGVSYGGHGVWGWDDGSGPPTDHPNAGTPLPWSKALYMPAAGQMRHVAAFFSSIGFWRLRPSQELLARQPGADDASDFIAVSASPERDLLVAYTPVSQVVSLRAGAIAAGSQVSWFNPRTGEHAEAVAATAREMLQFPAPGEGDWVLVASTAPAVEP